MNSTSRPVPDLLPCVASAARLGIQTRRPTHRLGLLAAAVALLAISPLAKAQTTFVGSWIQYVPALYGEIEELEVSLGTYSLDDHGLRSGYVYVGVRKEWYEASGMFGDEWKYYERWRPVIQEPQFNPQTDNHWNNVNVWTDGVPTSTSDARITKAGSLILPTINETAAVARSLTVFDADNTYSTFNLLDGVVSLTPASVFETALRVGVANANGEGRLTILRLVNSTLTSSGFAEIGKGQTGSGQLVANMVIGGGSRWIHPAGLIEIGGEGGSGYLRIDSDGLLAGSLLAGAATDPRVVVHPGGSFRADLMSTVRLSELLVNAGDWEPGYPPVTWGAIISGTFDAGLFHLGETVQGTAYATASSNSKFGQVILERASWLELWGTAAADSIEVRDGMLKAASLTVGTAGGDRTTTIMTLGRDSGSSALLQVPATPSGGSANVVTVHGAAQLGRYGTANVQVLSGSTLDIRGKATFGQSESYEGGAAGSGTVIVDDGVLRAQEFEIGYSYFAQYGMPAPTGRLNVGGRVEVTGWTQPFIPPLSFHYGGYMLVGTGGTLDFTAAGGKVLFLDPSDGGTLDSPLALTNHGLITGGDSTGSTPLLGGHIDFGDRGGTFSNRGTIAPGHSAGWLAINGNLTLESSSTLLMEIGGTARGSGYDVLSISGDFSAGGTLAISFLNGFVPTSGTTFDLFDFGSLNNTFLTINVPEGSTWNLDSLYATGEVTLLTAAAIPEVGTILPALAAALVAGWRLRRQWRGRQAG